MIINNQFYHYIFKFWKRDENNFFFFKKKGKIELTMTCMDMKPYHHIL